MVLIRLIMKYGNDLMIVFNAMRTEDNTTIIVIIVNKADVS